MKHYVNHHIEAENRSREAVLAARQIVLRPRHETSIDLEKKGQTGMI